MLGRSLTKEGPVLPPRMLFAGLASPCGELLLLLKQNTLLACNGPLSLCKGPCLPERGHTICLRAACVVQLGGLSDGLKGPCIGLICVP